MKRIIYIGLALMLLSAAVLPYATAFAAGTPTVTVETLAARRGATVAVPVTIANPDGVHAGGFNVTYDPSQLELLTAVGIGTVNKNYGAAGDTVRMSFASVAPVAAALLTLTFRVRPGASYGDTDLILSSLKLADENGETIASSGISGRLRVESAAIALQSAKGVIGQAALVDVVLGEGILPAGGSFEITYDPARVTPVSVKAAALLETNGLTVNPAYTQNSLKLTWAGSEPLASVGKLCTVAFKINADASPGATAVDIKDLRLYDENSAPVDAVGTGATITMERAETAIPELVISRKLDGATDTVTVWVTVRGSDTVYGGSVNLDFDADSLSFLSSTALASGNTISVVSDSSTGNALKVAWATPIPVAKSTHLAELRFSVVGALGGALPVAARDAVFFGNEATAIDGTVTADLGLASVGTEIAVLAPEEPVITLGAATSSVAVDIDVDSIAADAETREVTAMIALYKAGRMTGFAKKTFQVNPGETTRQTMVSTANGEADSCNVILLDGDGLFSPLCRNIRYEIGEGG
jgi:hypothetical protein